MRRRRVAGETGAGPASWQEIGQFIYVVWTSIVFGSYIITFPAPACPLRACLPAASPSSGPSLPLPRRYNTATFFIIERERYAVCRRSPRGNTDTD